MRLDQDVLESSFHNSPLHLAKTHKMNQILCFVAKIQVCNSQDAIYLEWKIIVVMILTQSITVMDIHLRTVTKYLCKWGDFERAKTIFKILQAPWTLNMFWGRDLNLTVCRSKGCKATSSQSWRSPKNVCLFVHFSQTVCKFVSAGIDFHPWSDHLFDGQ